MSLKGNGTYEIFKADLQQNFRSKSFWLYTSFFALFVAVMFMTGITESQVIGFVGLSRLLVTFMQVSMVILPIYVLISTVRALVGEKENGVLEYTLSLPISFSQYFWGKFWSRFVVIYLPVLFALILAVFWGMLRHLEIPWKLFFLYVFLLASMIFFFLGLSMYISARSRTQENALGISFMIWIFLVAFMDILLIGMMLRMRINPEVVISLALLNPLQVFRTGSLILFDPKLTVMGPVSYYILDTVNRSTFIAFAIEYPVILGLILAWLGNRYFNRHDVV